MKKTLSFLWVFMVAVACYSQNVGLGESNPASKGSIKGNLSVGNNYSTIAAPANGAIIEGNVGIGDATAPARLFVKGDGTNPIFSVVDNTAVSKVYVDPTGKVGINTNAPNTSLDVRTSDAIQLPSGTTVGALGRPVSPVAGFTRFNTDTKALEYYDGTEWVSANITQVPIGTIAPYGGSSAPTGWLLCDGLAVSRTTYSDLYAAIGNAWGYGDNSTTFNLPDLRGRFLRGVDAGTGRDPDAATRLISNTGGNTGDAVGTIESQALLAHNHAITDPGHTHNVDPANTALSLIDPGHFHTTDPANTALVISDPGHGHGVSYNGNPIAQNPSSIASGGFAAGGAYANTGYGTITINNATTGISGAVNIAATNSDTKTTGITGTVDIANTTSTNTATGITISNSTGTETRPINAGVVYIIKATNTSPASIVAVNTASGTAGQTLYHNGSNWTPTSNLYNNGTNVGIGTVPSVAFDVVGATRLRNLSTGVVKADASGNLSSSLITNADVADVAWGKVTGAPAFITGNQTISLSGEVTGSGTTAIATTIANNAVTSAKIADGTVDNADLANMAALSVKGNATNAAAAPTDIAAANDNEVLRRSGTAIGFGSVNLASSSAVTGILPVANGGTGSSSQNWVDLTTNQTAAGVKTWSNNAIFNGRVGIGTTSPTLALLDVNQNSGVSPGTAIKFGSRGFLISPSTILSDNAYFNGTAFANVANDFSTYMNMAGGAFSFATSPSGASPSFTERMVINNIGRVGIGATPSVKLDVQDVAAGGFVANFLNMSTNTAASNHGIVIRAGNPSGSVNSSYYVYLQRGTDGAFMGGISQSTASTVLYNTSSDKRLKENILSSSHGLSDINRLAVKDYNYIGDTTKVTGLIAQEVYKVIPSVVHVGGDDVKTNAWGIDYGKLTPYLIKAVQEQQSEIELLKSENSNLKNNNEVLSNDIKTMKAQIDVINEQMHIRSEK